MTVLKTLERLRAAAIVHCYGRCGLRPLANRAVISVREPLKPCWLLDKWKCCLKAGSNKVFRIFTTGDNKEKGR